MDNLNLYREAKEHYEKLIPDKNDGLILLSLYEKYKENDFSEENIISIVNRVFKDQGNDTTRTEYNRNNTIILRLQESFLWRNQSRKTYQFKKYGLEFCQNIEKRLIEKYNPAKIKRFFTELHQTLVITIENQKDFDEWMEDHFDVRMPELASQIEILDQQVNESVGEFKTNFRSGERNSIDVLREIEIRLEIIKEQSSELKNAFQISYDIDELLTVLLERNQEIRHLHNIHRVQHFHDSCRSQLEQVSKRIEKIKPRIREFIYDFNKQDFDRKTNKFIQHLLTKSVIRRDAGPKRIRLPEHVSGLRVKSTADTQVFTIVPIRKISRKEAVPAPKKEVDPYRSAALMEKTLAWQRDKQRIKYWTDTVFLELEAKGVVLFTPLFFAIVTTDTLAIAVKTAHNVLRNTAKQKQKYQVEILQTRDSQPQNKSTAIWQMTLRKK